ncbi:hypothetical protein BS47DRAFT_457273 [Hydnum rufescens UP504]|uniref:Uncharacterized protein n=1 Tax=Hydnum rufescens UP504 TaxID=1448309 RepID=A0A9P6AIK5_9AGAM|nr:hypothetical protein BS47DRAFT_457273 [Hydnum rufescens UP504]
MRKQFNFPRGDLTALCCALFRPPPYSPPSFATAFLRRASCPAVFTESFNPIIASYGPVTAPKIPVKPQCGG